jgi:hypothetical protein
MLWLQRSQMFIDFAGQPLFGAPAERNALLDEYFESCISLRWSEEPYSPEVYKHSVPSGLGDVVGDVR